MDSPLARVLESTGFLENGEPAAPTVVVDAAGDVQSDRLGQMRRPSFCPDVWWRGGAEPSQSGLDAGLRVYFKFVEDLGRAPVHEWQREVWNRGFAPLLWVVSPEQVALFNGFGVPRKTKDANRLRTFRLVDEELGRLDRLAGRIVMETGQIWHRLPEVDRSTGVDQRLLSQLGALERLLVDDDLARNEAQGLIGRSVFMQYLLDGGAIDGRRLSRLTGHATLPAVFGDRRAAKLLFRWLRKRFNGDMFPSEALPKSRHLSRIGEFLAGTDPESGQRSFFPYQFDAIPVEMISAIYEQFLHSSDALDSDHSDAFYTPLAAVSLVLDEILADCVGDETVLDLTCGSGVFLVEALRRLVYLQAGRAEPTRDVIRRVLYSQIHGVDISSDAIRIAAFSLYLAALELDPDPGDSSGIRFEPLVGRTLIVGDAFSAELPERPFDVIVGNPPWSFKGVEGTATRRARGTLVSPRGESFDFVKRALEFGHEETRLGMLVSATPFFSLSATGIEAAQEIVEQLAPVTLVNLSELAGWLFPKAKMPAMALLASRRSSDEDEIVLVQVPWSPVGKKSRMIEIAPSDVATLPLEAWRRNANLLKAAFLGSRHDLVLLDELTERYNSLGDRLKTLGAPLRSGLILGRKGGRSASHLHGLPFAGAGIGHFDLPDDMPPFSEDFVERPRPRETYEAPLLLVAQNLRGIPRPVVAVSERDLVFTGSYYGASFRHSSAEIAYLLAGILGSAFASWYLLLTGSAFGLWKRRVKQADVEALPVPDPVALSKTPEGRRVVEIVTRRQRPVSRGTMSWRLLDEAVFDLYGFDESERLVVRDGLFRGTWQWDEGRQRAAEAVDVGVLRRYAEVFLATMDDWLASSGLRRMRAEVIQFDQQAPLRIVRFILEDQPGPSSQVELVHAEASLRSVLDRIGARAKVRIGESLIGVRDLRVHAEEEVSIIKPAAHRNWLMRNALEDADAVVQDSLLGLGTRQ